MPNASPAAPLPDTRPRRKGELTRERILDAAEELFAERGFEGATLRDVAGRVGLRNPSLYNHFSNKESLYKAVLERGLGPVLQLLAEQVQRPDESAERAETIVRAVMGLLAERPALPKLIQHETLAGGQRLTPLLRNFIAPVFSHGHEMAMPRALESGWEAEDVPLLVLSLIHVVLGFFTMAPLYRDLNGVDLLGDAALERQTRLLIELCDRLFTPFQHASSSE